MSELNYKELQEQGVFDVPYRAFEFMQEQQAKIDAANEILKNIVVYEQDIHAINQINKLKDLLK